MDYGDINNRWKQFLAENTFKEDKKKKSLKKNIDKKTGKEIIVSEKEEEKLEDSETIEEMSSCSGGGVQGYAGTQGNKKEEEK